MALNLGRSKKWADLSLDELRYFAGKAELPETLVLDTAVETVALFHEKWNKEKKHLPLTTDTLRIIEKHANAIPLVKHTRRR